MSRFAWVGVASCVLLAACSSSNSDSEKEPSAEDAYAATYEGTGVVIVRMDASDPSCGAGASGLDRATFAKCTHLDVATLPEPLVLFEDPGALDPRRSDGSFLVANTEDGWLAITSLGVLPTEAASGPLVRGQSLRPTFIPLLIGAGEVLVEIGAGALLRQAAVSTIRFFAGRALVAEGGEVLAANAANAVRAANTAQTLVRTGQQLLSACSQPGNLADGCDESKCRLLYDQQKLLCDEGGSCNAQMAANQANCSAAGRVLSASGNCAQKRREVQLCFRQPDFDGHQQQIDQQCRRFVACEALGQSCQQAGLLDPRSRPSLCANMIP